MVWYDYQWMVGVGATLSFFTAYGIGANDLANAFASSVGSRALTIPQACLIAAIFEFAGAVGLGSIVTDTIRSGIVNYKYFTKQPEIYMLGMLCVIGATGLWLLLATLLEMPVSTTHSCVGGVIGFGICAGGVNSVVWYKVGKAGEFPVGGVSGIFISWVFSPVASGILAAAFFWIARTTTLRQKNSFAISFWTYPAWIFVALWLNLLFILLKGGHDVHEESVRDARGPHFHGGLGRICSPPHPRDEVLPQAQGGARRGEADCARRGLRGPGEPRSHVVRLQEDRCQLGGRQEEAARGARGPG